MRWENAKTGRTGYAPACANDWVKGVCGKPQVKCGECQNQAFIPVSDEVIVAHLHGMDPKRPRKIEFVVGVYPLLLDETCWFLAMPISWKGTLAQYVGRLHREHQDKHEIMVYDYVDLAVPVLARMAARRQAGYRALGYVPR